jgi:hypothetical protein
VPALSIRLAQRTVADRGRIVREVNYSAGGLVKIEETAGHLRGAAIRLFDYIEQLTGSRPAWHSSWYRATNDLGGAFLFIRFPERAQDVPAGTIHLVTRSDDRLMGPHTVQGNYWFGRPSTDFVAAPDREEEVAAALEFVRQVNEVYRPIPRTGRRSGGG